MVAGATYELGGGAVSVQGTTEASGGWWRFTVMADTVLSRTRRGAGQDECPECPGHVAADRHSGEGLGSDGTACAAGTGLEKRGCRVHGYWRLVQRSGVRCRRPPAGYESHGPGRPGRRRRPRVLCRDRFRDGVGHEWRTLSGSQRRLERAPGQQRVDQTDGQTAERPAGRRPMPHRSIDSCAGRTRGVWRGCHEDRMREHADVPVGLRRRCDEHVSEPDSRLRRHRQLQVDVDRAGWGDDGNTNRDDPGDGPGLVRAHDAFDCGETCW